MANQERQNIEKSVSRRNRTIFTPDTKRGRVMVHRDPRTTPPSYQRDDEYRSTEGYRRDRPEWFLDTREPSDSVRNYHRRDDDSPRQLNEGSIIGNIVSASRDADRDTEAVQKPDSAAPPLRSKAPTSRRKGNTDT